MEESGMKSGEEGRTNDDLLDMFLEVLKRNITRSRLMADLWAGELLKDIAADVPPERFLELYRIVSFDILENLMTIVPPEQAMVIATNMDHFLQIELLNQKYGVDIMDRFQKEFLAEHGDSFSDQNRFSELVARFESEWANTRKDYLDGLTPDEALESTYREWLNQWESVTAGDFSRKDPLT